MEKKEIDISQILVDYGVYNQSGINAIKLDKELRELLDKAKEEGVFQVVDKCKSWNEKDCEWSLDRFNAVGYKTLEDIIKFTNTKNGIKSER